MRSILSMALITSVLTCAQLVADERDKTPVRKDKLIGEYVIQSGERGGKKIEPTHLHDVSVTVAANAITTFDKDKKQVYAATYKLDTGKKPWKITMTTTLSPKGGKGDTTEGLIEQDGDTVRLIYALPKGKTPTEFKTSEGQQMFVMKRSTK